MADGASPERFTLLMELAGQCLLRYQRIEHALKLMLPHVVKPGDEPLEDAPDWRQFVDGRYTLGPLMELFKERMQAEDSTSVHAQLERIVGERNDLLHHFFTLGGVLASTEGLEDAVSELRQRLEHSRWLEQALFSMVSEFARQLERSLEATEGERHSSSHEA